MALRSLWSRLFLCVSLLYGALLFVLQLSLRTSPQPEPQTLLAFSSGKEVSQPFKLDYQLRELYRPLYHLDTKDGSHISAKAVVLKDRNNFMSQINTTMSLQGRDVNSILMRKLKETRLQLASKLKSASMVAWSKNEKGLALTVQGHKPTAVPFLSMADDFFIYKALLDNRFQRRYVRVFGLCPSVEGDYSRKLTCLFNVTQSQNNYNKSSTLTSSITKENTEIVNDIVAVSIPATKYAMCENHGKKYGGWIFTCRVPPHINEPFASLSLTLTATDSKDYSLPLQYIQGNRRSPKVIRPLGPDSGLSMKTSYKIGVCVPPLYGNIDLTRIVNFVEMSRILGANQILLYINDISMEIQQMLQDYVLLYPSFLELIQWDLPIIDRILSSTEKRFMNFSTDSMPLPASEVIWNRGQLLAIQHCLYTYMDDFDWLLFMDVDEMLFPKKSFSWSDLYKEIIATHGFKVERPRRTGGKDGERGTTETPSKVAGFVFQSALFHADFQSQAQFTIDYFQKTSRANQTDPRRSKLAVRPGMVFEMGIHHVSRAVREGDQTLLVPTDLALLHHYREEEPTEQGDYYQESGDIIVDASSLKYQSLLTEASQTVMNNLGKMMIARRKSFPLF